MHGKLDTARRERSGRPWRLVVAVVSAALIIASVPAVGTAHAEDHDVLWQNMNNQWGLGWGSTNDTGIADVDTESADDFVVPKRRRWIIDRVDAKGFFHAQRQVVIHRALNVPEAVRVRFYLGGGSLPGAQIGSDIVVPFAEVGDPHRDGKFAIPVPPIELAAGQYWVSVQVDQDSTVTGWRWAWNGREVVAGTSYGVSRGGSGEWQAHSDHPFFADLQFTVRGTLVVR